MQTRARKEFYGDVRENPANMAALDELRQLIDEAVFADRALTDDALRAYCYNRRMTAAQTRKALAYRDAGGALSDITKGAVLTQWRTLHPDKTEKDFPKWLLPAIGLMQRQRPGKPWVGNELRGLIARLEMEGRIPNGLWFWPDDRLTYGAALAEGREKTWEADNGDGEN